MTATNKSEQEDRFLFDDDWNDFISKGVSNAVHTGMQLGREMKESDTIIERRNEEELARANVRNDFNNINDMDFFFENFENTIPKSKNRGDCDDLHHTTKNNKQMHTNNDGNKENETELNNFDDSLWIDSNNTHVANGVIFENKVKVTKEDNKKNANGENSLYCLDLDVETDKITEMNIQVDLWKRHNVVFSDDKYMYKNNYIQQKNEDIFNFTYDDENNITSNSNNAHNFVEDDFDFIENKNEVFQEKGVDVNAKVKEQGEFSFTQQNQFSVEKIDDFSFDECQTSTCAMDKQNMHNVNVLNTTKMAINANDQSNSENPQYESKLNVKLKPSEHVQKDKTSIDDISTAINSDLHFPVDHRKSSCESIIDKTFVSLQNTSNNKPCDNPNNNQKNDPNKLRKIKTQTQSSNNSSSSSRSNSSSRRSNSSSNNNSSNNNRNSSSKNKHINGNAKKRLFSKEMNDVQDQTIMDTSLSRSIKKKDHISSKNESLNSYEEENSFEKSDKQQNSFETMVYDNANTKTKGKLFLPSEDVSSDISNKSSEKKGKAIKRFQSNDSIHNETNSSSGISKDSSKVAKSTSRCKEENDADTFHSWKKKEKMEKTKKRNKQEEDGREKKKNVHLRRTSGSQNRNGTESDSLSYSESGNENRNKDDRKGQGNDSENSMIKHNKKNMKNKRDDESSGSISIREAEHKQIKEKEKNKDKISEHSSDEYLFNTRKSSGDNFINEIKTYLSKKNYSGTINAKMHNNRIENVNEGGSTYCVDDSDVENWEIQMDSQISPIKYTVEKKKSKEKTKSQKRIPDIMEVPNNSSVKEEEIKNLKKDVVDGYIMTKLEKQSSQKSRREISKSNIVDSLSTSHIGEMEKEAKNRNKITQIRKGEDKDRSKRDTSNKGSITDVSSQIEHTNYKMKKTFFSDSNNSSSVMKSSNSYTTGEEEIQTPVCNKMNKSGEIEIENVVDSQKSEHADKQKRKEKRKEKKIQKEEQMKHTKTKNTSKLEINSSSSFTTLNYYSNKLSRQETDSSSEDDNKSCDGFNIGKSNKTTKSISDGTSRNRSVDTDDCNNDEEVDFPNTNNNINKVEKKESSTNKKIKKEKSLSLEVTRNVSNDAKMKKNLSDPVDKSYNYMVTVPHFNAKNEKSEVDVRRNNTHVKKQVAESTGVLKQQKSEEEEIREKESDKKIEKRLENKREKKKICEKQKEEGLEQKQKEETEEKEETGIEMDMEMKEVNEKEKEVEEETAKNEADIKDNDKISNKGKSNVPNKGRKFKDIFISFIKREDPKKSEETNEQNVGSKKMFNKKDKLSSSESLSIKKCETEKEKKRGKNKSIEILKKKKDDEAGKESSESVVAIEEKVITEESSVLLREGSSLRKKMLLSDEAVSMKNESDEKGSETSTVYKERGNDLKLSFVPFKNTSENVSTYKETASETNSVGRRKPKTTYNNFLESLKHPSCKMIVDKVKNFILNFPQNITREAAAKKVHNFISETQPLLLSAKVYKNLNNYQLGMIIEGYEKFIMQKLYFLLYQMNSSDKDEDEKIYTKINCLEWIELKHLEIADEIDLNSLEMAQRELLRIQRMKAPKDKLIMILNCCRIVTSVLYETKKRRKQNKKEQKRKKANEEQHRGKTEELEEQTNVSVSELGAEKEWMVEDGWKQEGAVNTYIKNIVENSQISSTESKSGVRLNSMDGIKKIYSSDNISDKNEDDNKSVGAKEKEKGKEKGTTQTNEVSPQMDETNEDNIKKSSYENKDHVNTSINATLRLSKTYLNETVEMESDDELLPCADEVLPLLIYVIIKTNPHELISNILYIQYFRHPNHFISEEAYSFTQFCSGVEFIKELGKTTFLNISEEEYKEKVSNAEQKYLKEVEESNKKLQEAAGKLNDLIKISSKKNVYANAISKIKSLDLVFEKTEDLNSLTLANLPSFFQEYKKLVQFKNEILADLTTHYSDKPT